MTLFDLDAGRDDRDQGTEQALNAKQDWHAGARRVILLLAFTRQPFTVDDFLERFRTPAPIGVNANNAIGALFLTMSRQGIIRKVGHRVPSKRRSNHGRYVEQWIGNL